MQLSTGKPAVKGATMFDYKDLNYIRVLDVTVTGDTDRLAQAVAEHDANSEATAYMCDLCPTFDGCDDSETLSIAYVDEDGAGMIEWTCAIDLESLDWPHPWEDQRVMDAEAVYYRRRVHAETRWVLPHLHADAMKFLRRCAFHCEEGAWVTTPKDADEIMTAWFFGFLHDEAEEMDPDPMAELLTVAMGDAEPIGTGIPQLDAVLGGGLHKGLTVIAGDPGSGKTTFAIQATLYTSNQREGRVVYDMADMGGKKSALLRMISCAAAVAGVEGCNLGKAGEWDAREVYQGREAFDRVSRGRVHLCDTTEVTEFVSQLDYHARTEGVTLAVLDFAQSATHDGKPLAFDVEAASLACRELRVWAHRHNAVVLLLSAFNKSASLAHSRGAEPTMNDVLGSAELAYSAEHVLALANRHDGSGKVIVTDLKHRHGNGKPCTVNLDAAHGLFS